MARSVLGLVGLAATLVFALPAGMLGLDYLIRGETFPGVALLVTAVLMIAVERYITTPGDLTSMVASQTVGRVVKTEDEE